MINPFESILNKAAADLFFLQFHQSTLTNIRESLLAIRTIDGDDDSRIKRAQEHIYRAIAGLELCIRERKQPPKRLQNGPKRG